ncbi:MAG: branched-chain amino acid transaminase [Xanthomonadales bacterium]|nr:branched-chain amino acid transaminase [Gammaproteobacteria bacterium]MBT8054307.1 branched-chain amino acid transaminase [Gammaproteobacteria bacterium]NND57500.1 branched-chain amino acid transaminase [Xanthomonadales bacterium]NNK51224.1 branched-chain amino acid transaminase [Xanthomonadales bacterium]
MSNERRIWFNGKLRESKDCMVHVASHALHYGSSVFEGIRAYETPDGTMIFRGMDHLERLKYSAAVYRIPVPYSVEELHQACCETVRDSGLASAYIRPLVARGNCGLGVMPKDMSVVDVSIIVSPWGAYLGEEGLRNGIKACITSWQRLAPNTMPPGVKAGGNYLSSQLIGMEARDRGFEEGIGLGSDGLLSEGAGENIFIVQKGRLLTPPASSSILSGLTRETVIILASELGISTQESTISREQLYAADEVFMTGTAAEVTPVRQVDHMTIGNGGCGPVTQVLQDEFFGLFDGRTRDKWSWLEPVR